MNLYFSLNYCRQDSHLLMAICHSPSPLNNNAFRVRTQTASDTYFNGGIDSDFSDGKFKKWMNQK